MNMRFVIDESSWQFDHLPHETCSAVVVQLLDQLLDQIELALSHDHGVCYSEELFWQTVWQDKTFYDLLAPECACHIPHEIYERLSSIIYKLSTWQELPAPQPINAPIYVNGEALHAASIAWAAIQTQANQASAVAALILPSCRPAGCCTVGIETGNTPIWLVADSASYQNFFRWLITETSQNPAQLAQWARSAFLQLDFYADAMHGIKSMSKPFRELLPDLVRHLAALSDHGQKIFSDSWIDAPNRFGQYGVNMSPENGNTKGNDKARRERTKTHEGREVVFWWHSKLEPHQDRIHFYPDDAAKTGRILVGIFCKHLTT